MMSFASRMLLPLLLGAAVAAPAQQHAVGEHALDTDVVVEG